MNYFFVAFGLSLLILGGEFLVRGAVSLALKLKVSTLLIALTVIAFGTSMPELLVSIDAALSGSPELAIGNIVGSNIANILLVLGLPALIAPIALGHNIKNYITLIIAYILFIIFSFDLLITNFEGTVLFISLVIFLFSTYIQGKKDRKKSESISTEVNSFEVSNKFFMILILLILGIIGLFFGSDLLIRGAVGIASDFNVSKEIIGLSLLAIGTSLPELTTSIIAAIKKQGDFIIGNIIGSNIFNTLGVAGLTSLLVNIPVKQEIVVFDLSAMFLSLLFLMPLIFFKIKVSRYIGILLFALYITYIFTIFIYDKNL
ncbi:MAG: Inner membrane protein YrbG [Alphaproteobacteria bacterium MarineAlpha2_Bin1]|nr:MAG: Inner membrane protein YrbG [Alphaproteobacteria bacterium MarineAlpha2_Bin1]